MDVPLLLAEKVVVSAGIGLMIGLEREWAHKEAGTRSFSFAALLGTLAWLVSPTLAFIEVGVVLVLIALVNASALHKDLPLQVTTSFALAATNVLGILVGSGAFFLAFTSAIVLTALLSWKTELVTFTSKLTEAEIRSALLLAFITAVIYPLLPDRFIDPWNLVNLRSIWLTVLLVSGIDFVNYILLRQLGARGMRYSAILGGLVNSAAISALLGQELKQNPDTAPTIPANFLLADLAMIFRNAALVVIFSWSAGLQESFPTLIVLVPMMLVAGISALVVFVRSHKKPQQAPRRAPFTSPLGLRYVLSFGFLFLSLTVLSGLGQRFFGAIGFLAVVVVGALASAASSAVLVGTHISMHSLHASPAAIAMYFATLVGLVENIVILSLLTRERAMSTRIALLSLPMMLVGGAIMALLLLFGQ
jgi:uncharacterized membrane protein (DUF4010 family)